MKPILIFVLLFGFAGNAFGEDDFKKELEETDNLKVNSKSGYRIFIRGGASCGEWDYARKKPSILQNVYMAWVSGFITGANLMNEHYIDLAEGVDTYSIYLWIDKYCKENPLTNSLSLVLDVFFAEFLKRYYCKHSGKFDNQICGKLNNH